MENLSKHAYLIIAHKNDLTFNTLLKMLDDKRNDIFIHLDIKNKNYSIEEIKKKLRYSSVYFTERTNVMWGGYSQINCELLLLKLAINVGKYKYYHLLSGEDLPIKTQNYIHCFFNNNEGKEFVRFESNVFKYKERIKFYYLFQERIGRNGTLFIRVLNKFSILVQKILKINRNRNQVFQKGTNWFSITDDLARYVVEKEEWINEVFHNTICCDELFLQTIIHNSYFKDNLYYEMYDNSLEAIKRLIDWKRGNPYVFKEKDFNELKKSSMLYARKFDANIDRKIINKIYDEFNQNKKESY
ncbi:beta-1,6-N-acetylglucosaminyltransferase [Clostridium perfringens]|uniref:beta-1,6-N-acetylglucosaminyltransferase n=1 Tax=Clostridium perfringens TaxID=1502 RepID=UPI001CB55544|nr:beta-1,6-N-acetylglucosaminyltransferase [Clostridium perfringens]MDH5075725.1 Core-2/I-Branching enzyme [Clostridium perfringens]MDM0624601.1 beta-1,6-N-acetylglucosaminyltransferase [Clostridium perfringens]MDM0745678.1 beta-1,6-N-acetylglucosaminyltransferase [Clostridium perfringens]STB61376.1 Core-2/I-Branching enzyme [Clostridium perfringens]